MRRVRSLFPVALRSCVRVVPSEFRTVVEAYTADEDLFFKDFSSAFAKLLSLGTPSKPAGGGGAGVVQSILSMIGMGK